MIPDDVYRVGVREREKKKLKCDKMLINLCEDYTDAQCTIFSYILLIIQVWYHNCQVHQNQIGTLWYYLNYQQNVRNKMNYRISRDGFVNQK